MAAQKKPKQLHLSKDKKLLGVCGGIAEYYDLDPTLVRIIVLILIFFSGFVPGTLVYFIVGLFIMSDNNAKK
jgi:phage shock protein C